MSRVEVINFNSGELSPQIDSRSETKKYSGGCRILENMIPRIYGPATRRPGTEYINTTKYSPQGIRLMPFIYSASIAYMIEAGDLYFRFYYNGAVVKTGTNKHDVPIETATPYLVADLNRLHYAHVGDVMRIVHGSYRPRKLIRATALQFDLDVIEFNNGPFRKRNDLANEDGITLTYTGAVAKGSSGVLDAVGGTVFDDPLHVDSIWKLTHARDEIKLSLEGVGTQDTFDDSGEYLFDVGTFNFVTHGTWAGTIKIMRKEGDNAWEDFRVYTADMDRNIQFAYTEKDPDAQYKLASITVTEDPDGDGTFTAEMVTDNMTHDSMFRITAVASAIQATVTVLQQAEAVEGITATLRWAEGSWSFYRGFPVSVEFYEGRCIYLGTEDGLATVWCSKTDDFDNFLEGVDDNDSFAVVVPSTNEPRWLRSLESLIVGTEGDEWRLGTSQLDSPVTPTTYIIKQQANTGGGTFQPLVVNSQVVFFDSVHRKMREISFTAQSQKYMTPDLTMLAEHISGDGFLTMAYQKNPDPILWTNRQDGTLCSMTYEREQSVIAWSRHPLGKTSYEETDAEQPFTGPGHYPTLRELTAAEIPSAPSAPTIADGTTTIANAAELLSKITADPTGSFILTDNIDLSGGWTPFIGFSGTLDGDGYTISNLTAGSSSTDKVGLFASFLSNAKVKDLTLDSFTLEADDWCAFLCAYADTVEDISVSNVTVTNSSATVTDDHVGGIFGYIRSNWENDSVISVYGCTIENCTLTGTGSGTKNYGGLIGFILFVAASVDFQSTATAEITDCHVVGGTITAEQNVGGLVGQLSGPGNNFATVVPVDESLFIKVHSCSSTASIVLLEGDITNVGGLLGNPDSCDIASCYASCDITDTVDCDTFFAIGGLIGIDAGFINITNSYSTGNITISNSPFTEAGSFYIGGFVGKCDITGTYLRCYSTVDIVLDNNVFVSRVGGFTGFVIASADSLKNPLISRCWAEGDITLNRGDLGGVNTGGVGGLVGSYFIDSGDIYKTTIQNCYSWSTITYTTEGIANNPVGGFIGMNDSEVETTDLDIINCYCAQTDTKFGSGYINQLPSQSNNGGFLGTQDIGTGTIVTENCFFDKETAGFETDASTALASTTETLMLPATFTGAGWDLDTIWELERAANLVPFEAEGIVGSVAVIPGINDFEGQDEVWMDVLRNVDGTLYRFIERMRPRLTETTVQDDWYFVDCGVAHDGSSITEIGGLDHIEGQTVKILGDGAVFAEQVVTGGQVTIPEAVSKAAIGLAYTYNLQPMRLDKNTSGGASHGMVKKISRIFLNWYKTLGAKYGISGNLYGIDWRTEEDYGAQPAPFSGDKDLVFDGGLDSEDKILITGDEPQNCTVRAIIVETDRTD